MRPSSPRTATGVLLIVYAIFICGVTAAPFRLDLTRRGILRNWKRAERIPFLNSRHSAASVTDAIGNILLFVPYGFLLYRWRRTRRDSNYFNHTGNGNAILPSLLVAVLFSLTIELSQIFWNNRYPSINDVINNGVGAYIGTRLARAYPEWMDKVWRELGRIAIFFND
jgi:glycopeptide antibiotics resistance protein